MIKLAQDFKDFLELLNKKEIEYLIVGGYAVGFHGYPRPTGDLDIWIATDSNNVESIVEAVRVFGFSEEQVAAELFTTPGNIVRMGLPPVRIEVMNAIDGVEFEECYRERETSIVDGIKVAVINRKHLKANKRASARNKDLNDLENLR